MKSVRILLALFSALFIGLTSCQKQDSSDDSNGNNNSSCNNTVMKFKKLLSLADNEDYLEAEWNSDGTPKKVTMNLALSQLRNATFVYEGGRIKEAVIRENYGGDIVDTALFHYDAGGRVDSMYFKNDDYSNIKLTYTAGNLVKYTHYSGTTPVLYWNVETDAKGNVTKAIEWWDTGSGFEKTSTLTFTRDDRKNPLRDLAAYMIFLDDPQNIFWYWGPNNYLDQNYQDHTGTGINLTTGNKFVYNDNCYPVTSETTINGQPVLNEPFFEYTYY